MTQRVADDKMEKGKEVIKTKGVDGLKTKKVQKTYVNGVADESKTKVLSEEITKEPVTQVIVYGTKEVKRENNQQTPPSSNPNNHGQHPRTNNLPGQVVKEKQEAPAPDTKKSAPKTTDDKKSLPNTGETNSIFASIAGIVVAGLAVFTWKRKKN